MAHFANVLRTTTSPNNISNALFLKVYQRFHHLLRSFKEQYLKGIFSTLCAKYSTLTHSYSSISHKEVQTTTNGQIIFLAFS